MKLGCPAWPEDSKITSIYKKKMNEVNVAKWKEETVNSKWIAVHSSSSLSWMWRLSKGPRRMCKSWIALETKRPNRPTMGDLTCQQHSRQQGPDVGSSPRATCWASGNAPRELEKGWHHAKRHLPRLMGEIRSQQQLRIVESTKTWKVKDNLPNDEWLKSQGDWNIALDKQIKIATYKNI